MQWTRKKKIALGVLAAIPLVWLLGDFVYSRVIAWRVAQWESQVEWTESGVRVGAEEYSIGAGDHAVLLIHGINDSPLGFKKMAPRLAEAGFVCRVMRLPGFGMSVEEYAQASMEDWLAAVGQEVQSLRKDHAHVSIAAHSLGGAVAIAYLREHPQAVESVALLTPAIKVSPQRSPLLSARAWHEIGNYLLLFSKVTETPFGNDAHDPAEQGYEERMPFVPRRVHEETFRLLDTNRGRAEEFRAPLFLAVSRHDRVVDWQAAVEFYQRAGSPIKEIYFAERAAHALPVDYGWEELTEEMAAFFRRVAAKNSPSASEPEDVGVEAFPKRKKKSRLTDKVNGSFVLLSQRCQWKVRCEAGKIVMRKNIR